MAISRSFGRQPTSNATSPAYAASRPQPRRADAPARLTSPDRSGRPLQDHENQQRVHGLQLCQVTVRNMPRYIILGAGAVGGALGGRLGLAGCNVVLVARGEHLAALRERSPAAYARRRRHPVRRGDRRAGGIQLDVDDVLILATKTQQANEALVTWTDAPCTRTLGDRHSGRAPADLHRAQRRRGGGDRASVLSTGLRGLRLDAGRASGTREVIIRSTPAIRDAPYRPRAGNR